MESQEIKRLMKKSNFTRLLSPAGESENQQDSERREASRRRGVERKSLGECGEHSGMCRDLR